MNNDLNDILDPKVVASNPFKVPKDYFSTLNSRIMDAIPEEQGNTQLVVAKTIRFKQLRWAAVITCLLVAGISIALQELRVSGVDETNAEIASQYLSASDDDAITQAADYTMMDNQDVYQLLAED